MQYSLSNNEIQLTVDTHGAEVRSLVKDGREYMWQADPAFWARTSPVLFPMVGSLKDKTMTSHGKTYSMGQHGFARDMEFTFVGQTENSLSFELVSSEETKALYPYDFKLGISYVIDGAQVRVNWQVENVADETMFFSIGAHPAFNCDAEGYYFLIEDRDGAKPQELSYYRLNQNGTVHVEKHNRKLNQGLLPIHKELFEKDALICTESSVGRISLVNPDGKSVVLVDFDEDCDCYGLWSPAGKSAPFVCIEPWYGTADYEDTDGIWEHKKHLISLAGKTSFERGYTITVC